MPCCVWAARPCDGLGGPARRGPETRAPPSPHPGIQARRRHRRGNTTQQGQRERDRQTDSRGKGSDAAAAPAAAAGSGGTSLGEHNQRRGSAATNRERGHEHAVRQSPPKSAQRQRGAQWSGEPGKPGNGRRSSFLWSPAARSWALLSCPRRCSPSQWMPEPVVVWHAATCCRASLPACCRCAACAWRRRRRRRRRRLHCAGGTGARRVGRRATHKRAEGQ
jgi:hypothetical protein